MRPDLPGDLKNRLKDAIVSMNMDEEGRKALREFGALQFIETSFKDYQPVIDMAETAGIDLAGWPLRDVRGDRPYR